MNFYEKLLTQQKYDEVQCVLVLGEMQYHRLTENIELTRRMLHDLRHHVITLQSFLKSGNTEQAEQYLSQVIQIMKEHEIDKVCSHAVVNLVVSYYQTQAKEQDIPFTIRIAIPDELSILDADLSIVLGNLLENAIYAAQPCEKKVTFIRLNMIRSGQILIVAVDNSFSEHRKMDGSKYLSTKANHISYGLQSVAAIAKKYDGGVEFIHEDGIFHSSVMLTTP